MITQSKGPLLSCTMEADFIDKMQQIRLTEEEGEVLEIRSTNRDKTLEECSLSLLGRFLSTRPYNLRAAKATIRAAWKLGSESGSSRWGKEYYNLSSHWKASWYGSLTMDHGASTITSLSSVGGNGA